MKRAPVLLLLVLPSLGHAYALKTALGSPNFHPRWPDGASVTFTLASDRPASIEAGTDVETLVRRGIRVWGEPSGITLDVVNGGAGLEGAMDGQNVITLADTPTNRDIVGENH